jgi:hypothetical protein
MCAMGKKKIKRHNEKHLQHFNKFCSHILTQIVQNQNWDLFNSPQQGRKYLQ